jgi:enoyl-CoA hydratase/carnithine racemase
MREIRERPEKPGMDDAVRYERADGIAWLTIDRPERRNALSREVRDGLWAGYRRFNADDEAGVLVLTGAGDRAFCAGGDLEEMAEVGLEVPPADFLPLPGRNLTVDKPTIAAVNGVALAGGFALVQYCDLCVAASTARLGITEAKVGRGTPWATPLPWLVPPRVAMELLLTAQPISAERALQLGLVNRVVPPDQLRAATHELASTILANAPLSVRAARQTVYLSARDVHGPLQDEADRIWDPVYRSADAQEGPRSFREHRPPHWTGR